MSQTFRPADGDVSGCEFLLEPVCEIVFHFEQSSERHWYAVYDQRLSQPSPKIQQPLSVAV